MREEGRGTFPLSLYSRMNSFLHIFLAICISIVMQQNACAETIPTTRQKKCIAINPADSLRGDSICNVSSSDSAANFHKEKLIAAILAFPVPFGFTGLHRIYLGSDPWIPVVYLITGGGGFGLVPLIDFIFIVTADEEKFRKYENNPKFFMWVE